MRKVISLTPILGLHRFYSNKIYQSAAHDENMKTMVRRSFLFLVIFVFELFFISHVAIT